MEETKVRRSGPGIKPVAGMVVRSRRTGFKWCVTSVSQSGMVDGVALDGAGPVIANVDQLTSDEVEVVSTPSPDPGEAPKHVCRGEPCGTPYDDHVRPGQVNGYVDGKWFCSRECSVIGNRIVYSDPCPDPRDVAIAKWPWMAPHRHMKPGDKFIDARDGSSFTVKAVHWDTGTAHWVDGCWSMALQHGWTALTPYREAKPVEAPKDWQPCDKCGGKSHFGPVCMFCMPSKSEAPQCDHVYLDCTGGDHECTYTKGHDGPCSHDHLREAKPHKSPVWTCSNGKECRTPGAPRHDGDWLGPAFVMGRCTGCVEAVKAAVGTTWTVVAVDTSRFTMPGEHAQLALKGGWRRGWR